MKDWVIVGPPADDWEGLAVEAKSFLLDG
jgi:hypothetical protein